jgi:hypothetical protein
MSEGDGLPGKASYSAYKADSNNRIAIASAITLSRLRLSRCAGVRVFFLSFCLTSINLLLSISNLNFGDPCLSLSTYYFGETFLI